MKETGNERHSWRAGVMSMTEGGRGRRTPHMKGSHSCESIFLAQIDSSERGYVCW